MAAKHPSLVPGGTVYEVPQQRYGDPRLMEIKSIGRKWVTLTNGDRFDPAGSDIRWPIDAGAYSPRAYAWINQAAYEDYMARDVVWKSLKRCIDRQHSVPSNMSMEVLRQIALALGVLEVEGDLSAPPS
jgi:hypothetical protein